MFFNFIKTFLKTFYIYISVVLLEVEIHFLCDVVFAASYQKLVSDVIFQLSSLFKIYW